MDQRWRWNGYTKNMTKKREIEEIDEETTMQAFLLALLGSTVFASESNHVKLALLP